MTDREALLALLERFGLAPATEFLEYDEPDVIELRVDQGNVKGYMSFHAIFDFDENGKFRELSLWE
jgi:hypothetical protein